MNVAKKADMSLSRRDEYLAQENEPIERAMTVCNESVTNPGQRTRAPGFPGLARHTRRFLRRGPTVLRMGVTHIRKENDAPYALERRVLLPHFPV